jgi:hypothetical protein
MKKFLWTVLSLFAVSLAACSTQIDSDLLNNESSCKPPCWHQLTPGQSTTSDVQLFLDRLSRFWWPDRTVHKYGAQIDSIRIIDRTQSKVIDFHMEDGKLAFIRSKASTSATLGQVVKYFGPPEYVRAALVVGPEKSIYELEAYYPKLGLSFEISPLGMAISPSQPDVGQINANMPVAAIQYYAPGDLRDVQGIRLTQEDVEKYLQPWPGFGTVRLLKSH